MGGCCSTHVTHFDPHVVSKAHFEMHRVVGQGGFGKVRAVQKRDTKRIYAMKELSKVSIIEKNSVEAVLNERNLLSCLKSPLIINMHYAFQDDDYLYMVMDLLPGGDLRYHLKKEKKFQEERAKFYAANLLLGLEYIHSQNVIHRDIKPENCVLDADGYPRITDLGVSATLRSGSVKKSSGTVGYIAPEIFEKKPHGIAADFYALGVTLYEFMNGRRPFSGKRDQIKAKVLKEDVVIPPNNWSLEGNDLIRKLLIRDPLARLGCRGAVELKEHPWFAGYDFKGVIQKTIRAPFIPKPAVCYFEGSYDIEDQLATRPPPKLSKEKQIVFVSFDWNTGRMEVPLKECITTQFSTTTTIPEEQEIPVRASIQSEKEFVEVTSSMTRPKARSTPLMEQETRRDLDEILDISGAGGGGGGGGESGTSSSSRRVDSFPITPVRHMIGSGVAVKRQSWSAGHTVTHFNVNPLLDCNGGGPVNHEKVFELPDVIPRRLSLRETSPTPFSIQKSDSGIHSMKSDMRYSTDSSVARFT